MASKTLLRTEKLLKLLSDGKFHSGQSIAEELEVSRTAVWKLVQKIQDWQITVYSVRGRGYQIPGGLALIEKESIEHALATNNKLFKELILLSSIDSTATYLALDWKRNPGRGRVCIAEHQSAGRGRKGRPWISPFGANLYFSIGVELPLGLSALGGLSLAVGICLCQTLNQLTNEPVKIKWPNDLLLDDKKLAGILVEASGDTTDSSFLNIGVGINWDMQREQGKPIDQPWANLKDNLKRKTSRTEILQKLLVDLDKALVDYLEFGFSNLVALWPQLSGMYQKEVSIHLPNRIAHGKEIGVESNGALRVDIDGNVKVFHSGEVSLRKKLWPKED